LDSIADHSCCASIANDDSAKQQHSSGILFSWNCFSTKVLVLV
jgi:hypothetical protein